MVVSRVSQSGEACTSCARSACQRRFFRRLGRRGYSQCAARSNRTLDPTEFQMSAIRGLAASVLR
jgi:positive regulator of sigma E activity